MAWFNQTLVPPKVHITWPMPATRRMAMRVKRLIPLPGKASLLSRYKSSYLLSSILQLMKIIASGYITWHYHCIFKAQEATSEAQWPSHYTQDHWQHLQYTCYYDHNMQTFSLNSRHKHSSTSRPPISNVTCNLTLSRLTINISSGIIPNLGLDQTSKQLCPVIIAVVLCRSSDKNP